jgi:hypothetical protein
MQTLTSLSPYGTEESVGCDGLDSSVFSGNYNVLMVCVPSGEGIITSKLMQSDDLEIWEDVPGGAFVNVETLASFQVKTLNTTSNKRYIKHESYTVPQCNFGMYAI